MHTGAVAGFTHIWASTYRGRRWLLFGRELARLPSHAVQFRRTLRRQRFELVHFNDSPLIPAAWLARHEGLPVVWHLRSALPEEGRDRRSGLIRRAIANLATTSIAINHDVADVFGVGSTIVPNSVDLQRFHPGDPAAARAALGLPADLPVVSFFGFIYPSKGFREFIEAAARLRERGVEASYLVVGGAVRGQEFFRTMVGRSLQLADLTRDYESEAKELVRELELDDVVRFIPFTQDTANLYQASDVVVAPSQGPELGRPVIEAGGERRPGRRLRLAHGRRCRRPGRDRRARRRLRRRLDRRRRRRPPPARRGGGARSAARRAPTRRRTSTPPATPGGSRGSTTGSCPRRAGSRSSTCTTARSSAALPRASPS